MDGANQCCKFGSNKNATTLCRKEIENLKNFYENKGVIDFEKKIDNITDEHLFNYWDGIFDQYQISSENDELIQYFYKSYGVIDFRTVWFDVRPEIIDIEFSFQELIQKYLKSLISRIFVFALNLMKQIAATKIST
jgi:hypothetical protein